MSSVRRLSPRRLAEIAIARPRRMLVIWAALVLTAVVHLYPCRRILGVQLLSRAACCGHSQSNTALTPCQMPRPPS